MSSVRPEYPRPHFDRSHSWLSLNGDWDFRRDVNGSSDPAVLSADRAAWSEQIVVPFAWESDASGIGAHWLEHAWYRREIDVPSAWAGQRIVLHFGAVHHTATVWVGGTIVGEHEGGYTPFEFDITDALAGTERATVLVRVGAPTDKRDIVHGKQRSIPRDDYDSCSFTPSSGIWQPVWLESRPATYISGVSLVPVDSLDAIEARIDIGGRHVADAALEITVAGERPVEVVVSDPAQPITIMLPIHDPRLWCPDDPQLYQVTVRLTSVDGADEVGAYTGLRSIALDGERLVLNGDRLYVRGVLDQGYWPGSGITAPDDEAFVTDIRLAREAGFTVIRKHLKLEDPRFLYHADRLGMLVWAEPASTGRFSEKAVARFEAQIEPMVRRDGNHPSIVIWGLYNEEWGLDWDVPGDPGKQEATRRAYQLIKRLDLQRPVVDDSGWSHVATDIVDWHIYDETPAGWAGKVRALIADGQPGFPVGLGPGLVIEKPLMALDDRDRDGRPNLNSEFGGGFTSVERAWNLRWQTLELRRYDELSGYVWTELYDVEHEMAGIYAASRARKDTAGSRPAETNADTVVIPEVVPDAPGLDIVAANGRVEFGVRISHHGTAPLEASLVALWGPYLGELEPGALSRACDSVESGTEVRADPFRLSETLSVSTQLPEDVAAARLHLALVSSGELVATTVVDVARASV